MAPMPTRAVVTMAFICGSWLVAAPAHSQTFYTNSRYYVDGGNDYYGRWIADRNRACAGEGGFGIGYDKAYYTMRTESCGPFESVVRIQRVNFRKSGQKQPAVTTASGISCPFAYISDWWQHTGGQKVCMVRNNHATRAVWVKYVTQPPRQYPAQTLPPWGTGRVGAWNENVDARCVLIQCEFADSRSSRRRGYRPVR
jgi:hypothetical protein